MSKVKSLDHEVNFLKTQSKDMPHMNSANKKLEKPKIETLRHETLSFHLFWVYHFRAGD